MNFIKIKIYAQTASNHETPQHINKTNTRKLKQDIKFPLSDKQS